METRPRAGCLRILSTWQRRHGSSHGNATVKQDRRMIIKILTDIAVILNKEILNKEIGGKKKIFM